MSKILEKIERKNRIRNIKGICTRLLLDSLESYKLNKLLLTNDK